MIASDSHINSNKIFIAFIHGRATSSEDAENQSDVLRMLQNSITKMPLGIRQQVGIMPLSVTPEDPLVAREQIISNMLDRLSGISDISLLNTTDNLICGLLSCYTDIIDVGDSEKPVDKTVNNEDLSMEAGEDGEANIDIDLSQTLSGLTPVLHYMVNALESEQRNCPEDDDDYELLSSYLKEIHKLSTEVNGTSGAISNHIYTEETEEETKLFTDYKSSIAKIVAEMDAFDAAADTKENNAELKSPAPTSPNDKNDLALLRAQLYGKELEISSKLLDLMGRDSDNGIKEVGGVITSVLGYFSQMNRNLFGKTKQDGIASGLHP